ncbi:MAG: hypothetical protein ACI8TX_003874 [Hyphomicrobiaceae bacterium]|jgi:hypothetical protein
MNTTQTGSLAALSHARLLHRFADLVDRDRRSTAELLGVIAEIDQRKLWAEQACPSMFAFCVERFRMSEAVAAKRIRAARTARQFPVIFAMVARGELHLSGIQQLAKILTHANHRAVLDRAKLKTSREIELLVAEVAPQPDVPSRIRALPRRAEKMTASTTGLALGNERPARAEHDTRSVVALSPRRYKIEITVDQATHDKLRMLEDLLSHQLPNTDPAQIVSRALDVLLAETLKKKAAMTYRPRGNRTAQDRTDQDRSNAKNIRKRTRAIPAAIKREVWHRDGGRCAFVDQRGRRCSSSRSVEYHHIYPFGKGGHHKADNISLRCRAHNQFQADLDFGKQFMDGRRLSAGEQAARPV